MVQADDFRLIILRLIILRYLSGRQTIYGKQRNQQGINTATNGAIIVEVTDGNFEQTVLKSDQPVLVDFWATWCSPCKALSPVVDQIATAYAGKVKVGKMDIDSNPSTPQRYGVRGIPTLLVFKNGQVQEQIVGLG